MKTFLKPWWGKLIAVVVLLLLIGIALAGYLFWQLRDMFPRAIPFDATLWQTANIEEVDNPRCLMQHDLEQNHLKLGMTRAQVTTLLGETQSNEKVLNYYLGFCNPFGIDPTALVLEFDDSDNLNKVYDVQY
jgi:hypothetical protein